VIVLDYETHPEILLFGLEIRTDSGVTGCAPNHDRGRTSTKNTPPSLLFLFHSARNPRGNCAPRETRKGRDASFVELMYEQSPNAWRILLESQSPGKPNVHTLPLRVIGVYSSLRKIAGGTVCVGQSTHNIDSTIHSGLASPEQAAHCCRASLPYLMLPTC
jgi:hypothetical protein